MILGSVPHYKANPVFLQGAITMMIMRQIDGAEVIGNAVDVNSESGDQATISVVLKRSSYVAENGYGANREVVYGVKAKTKSLCAEFQPGCLSIERKNVLETVSIKTYL
jgi:hypothetical protein